MPAVETRKEEKKGTYSHIYNRGIENRIIFKDSEDYKVFLGYLREYLSLPADPQNTKKTFTVNGRSFQGVPHQPKNYYNKVELVAYSLMPNHFSLLLKELSEKSQERFLRSLLTRYSMYFNKKYHRSGTLFQGPYKSVQVKGASLLLLLTRHLHSSGDYSSYPEYSGARISSWVRPNTILSLFQNVGKEIFPAINNYVDFVKKYELSETDKNSLEGIIFESASGLKSKPLERRIPKLERIESLQNVTASAPAEPKKESTSANRFQGIPELAAACLVFLILLTFGLRNIYAHSEISKPSPTPSVSGVSEVAPEAEEVTKKTIVVRTEENATVNIRKESSVESEKIGKAKDGDTFEFVSLNSDWYEIILADGSTGFVSKEFAQVQEEVKE